MIGFFREGRQLRDIKLKLCKWQSFRNRIVFFLCRRFWLIEHGLIIQDENSVTVNWKHTNRNCLKDPKFKCSQLYPFFTRSFSNHSFTQTLRAAEKYFIVFRQLNIIWLFILYLFFKMFTVKGRYCSHTMFQKIFTDVPNF